MSSEFDQACARACPHCADGMVARYRPETREWCHDYAATDAAIDTPALADGLALRGRRGDDIA